MRHKKLINTIALFLCMFILFVRIWSVAAEDNRDRIATPDSTVIDDDNDEGEGMDFSKEIMSVADGIDYTESQWL